MALNAVVGVNDALTMLPGPPSEQQERQLHTTRRNAQYLRSLINDLLDLGEIESGSLEVRTELVDLASVIREVTGIVRPMAEQKRLKFIDSTPGGKLVLRTDRRVLSRILVNLTSCAIGFTEMGKVHLEFAQRQEARELVTVISVVGTGSSIREEHQKKVAEAHRQLDSTTLRPPGEAGFGLDVSQRLAQLIGGEISLTSVYGIGSTFRLTLRYPLAE